jgi:hypothetical protein
MSFRTELLELKRQAERSQYMEVKEFVDELYREYKVSIEDSMKMSAKNGFINAAYFISPSKIEDYIMIKRKRIIDCLCELLEQEYPDIKFTAYAQGEISISWSE